MASPNLTTTDITQREGFEEQEEYLALGLTKEKLTRIVGEKMDTFDQWWEKKLNLKNVRAINEKRWLNKNFEVSHSLEPYPYQHPLYRDNRIFLSIETLVSNVVARIPEPVVTEGQDTDASRELATSYGNVLKKKADKANLKGGLQMAARHLLMGYRTGIIKWSWDYNGGRLKSDGTFIGDISVKCIRPHKIVIASEADDPDDIRVIGEKMRVTVGELISKFPNMKEQIKEKAGLQHSGETVRLGTKANYWEVWFTYFLGGKRKEAVCWKIDDLLLGAGPYPYYNYSKGTNYLDAPRKPYVFFRFLSDGQYVYDNTSLTEQTAKLQDVLEKRGRQIVENADKVNATEVFNLNMISAGEIEKYTGDPRQKIIVKGNVQEAFARVAPAALPSYVLQDKYDARAEIDNLFGTHAPVRGEKTEAKTLGQEVLSQRADLGRTRPLTDAIERGAVQVYEGITQLFKVFAKEEHMVKYAGPDGGTVFAQFSADKIEDGVEINIQAGSMMPDDKTKDKSDAMELTKMGGRIDPLSFFEKLHVPNPKEWAKRLIYFLWMPDRYIKEVLELGDETGNQDAMATIQRISAGENVPGKQDASKEYLAAYDQFVRSPVFQQLDPEVKQLHIMHLRDTVNLSKQDLGGKSAPAKPAQGGGNLIDKFKGMFGG